MRYTTFGNRTGLRVSELALGTSNFGTKWATGADEPTSARIFTTFAEAGGTFIDTADTYQRGESETYLAKFLASDREHFTLASKFTFGTAGQTGVSKTGNSRKTMRHALDASLRRLGTDYLDMYWVHSPDFVTPLDEIVEALDDLVRVGKILHGGLSNFPAWQVAAAVTGQATPGRTPVIATQFEYSLAARDGERDLLPMTEGLGIGAAVYSPLGGGLLTGKYRNSPKASSAPSTRSSSVKTPLRKPPSSTNYSPSAGKSEPNPRSWPSLGYLSAAADPPQPSSPSSDHAAPTSLTPT